MRHVSAATSHARRARGHVVIGTDLYTKNENEEDGN